MVGIHSTVGKRAKIMPDTTVETAHVFCILRVKCLVLRSWLANKNTPTKHTSTIQIPD